VDPRREHGEGSGEDGDEGDEAVDHGELAGTRPPRRSLALRLAVRFGVTRRQVLVVAMVAAAACVFAAYQGFQHRPRVTDVTVREVAVASPAAVATAGATPGASPTAAAFLLVHVVGKVAKPGVVRLPVGSRVREAVQAAGGATKGGDLSTVNLARVLVDGEQVVIGNASSSAAGGLPTAPVRGGNGMGGSGPVNLNTATLAVLDSLPHVGPVLAQRILDFRNEHGRFSSVDELGEVTGIGEKIFADLRPLVTV
jgi:competence protein ComEA